MPILSLFILFKFIFFINLKCYCLKKQIANLYAIDRGHTMESIQNYPEDNMVYALHCIPAF